MTKQRKCLKCGKKYTGYPAISRRDNKTEICPNCGTVEALEDFLSYKKGEKYIATTINPNGEQVLSTGVYSENQIAESFLEVNAIIADWLEECEIEEEDKKDYMKGITIYKLVKVEKGGEKE
jgi:predicted RNA-binding Zn-ribbon protein involved in translation (DUF1610 family)